MSHVLLRPWASLLLFSATACAHAGDGPVSARLGGRLHLDAAAFDNDDRGTPNSDGTEVRRAWLSVSGRLLALKYKVEGDFADPHDLLARDMYVILDTPAAGRFTLGQFKQHYMLDDRTGSNYGMFMERGMAASTLAPQYRLGLGWQHQVGAATWAASAYSLESIDVTANKGQGLAGRATWARVRGDDDVLHLGLSLIHERHDRPGAPGHPALKIRPRPAGHLADNSRMTLIDFSAGRDTDVDKWALEYARLRGRWSWQAEWSGARFRDGLQQGDLQGAYAMLGVFLTGESRAYDAKGARFSRITPPRHRAGAVELALRYDTLWADQRLAHGPDLTSRRMEALTLGANWYMPKNVRVMLDLIQSHNRDRRIDRTLDRTRAATLRVQYDF